MFKKYLDIFKYADAWHSEYMKGKKVTAIIFIYFSGKFDFSASITMVVCSPWSLLTHVFCDTLFATSALVCVLFPVPLRSRMFTTGG